MSRAKVYCRGVLAGFLDRLPAGYRFHYAADYLRNSACPGISLSLPKREAAFESAVLFPFFFGLLTEGDNKALQCRILRIDEGDHFTRLLKTCAIDTIGAVTVEEVP
jgi:serine/threonine-protein kinase HipA